MATCVKLALPQESQSAYRYARRKEPRTRHCQTQCGPDAEPLLAWRRAERRKDGIFRRIKGRTRFLFEADGYMICKRNHGISDYAKKLIGGNGHDNVRRSASRHRGSGILRANCIGSPNDRYTPTNWIMDVANSNGALHDSDRISLRFRTDCQFAVSLMIALGGS